MGAEFHPFTPSLLSSWRIITLANLLITFSSSQWDLSPPQQFLPSHKKNLRFSDARSNSVDMGLIAQSYSNIKEHKLINWSGMFAASRSASLKFSEGIIFL